ncbi:hypothetical protein LUZ60_001747 [Juncus effusus]|nr:hypothetical protein LUZ60_001747 [Juncus effusus]
MASESEIASPAERPNNSGDVSRPVAGTEFSWCQAVPGGTGTTVLAILFSKPVHLPSLNSSLNSLLTNHPILSSKLAFVQDSTPFFSIPSSPCVNIEAQPLSSSFHETIELELNRNPWSEPSYDDPVPVFFTTVYESPQLDQFVLCLRFHTAACDRASAVSILKELLILMASEANGDETSIDDVALKAGIEELIPKRDSSKPFWMRGKDLLGYSINGLRSSTFQFEDTESERRTEMIRFVFTKEETQNLLNECEERGVKLCGAISAAGLITARNSKQLEPGQSETYSVVTIVDCRKFLEPPLEKHNVGFYHSAITNTFSLIGSESLWDLAKTYHNSFTNSLSNKKHLTDISDLNFLMCKAIQNPSLTASSSLRTSLLSVFHEPVLYENCEDMNKLGQELGLVDYVGCASVHGIGPCVAVFDTIRNGELECCFVFPSPLHSRGQMERVVECVKSELVGACVHVELD